jgi:hypothetical protein
MKSANRSLILRRAGGALFGLIVIALPLVPQSNLEWRGDIGLRYFSRNPFISDPSSWRYVQGIANFSLSGHVWDPRFLHFSLGGDFTYTAYGGSVGSPNHRYFGYRIESRFFPKSKFSFGFRYLRNVTGTASRISETSSLKYALQEKGLDLSLSRVRFLPSLRLAYVDRSYRSSVSDSPRNERDKRFDLGVNKAVGISTFNLDYRNERYENQVLDRDRDHMILRATERLQLKGKTTVWFDGILIKDHLALPAGEAFESTYGQVSGNALSRWSERLRGNLRYAYVRSAIADRTYSLQTARAAVHYSIGSDLTVSPLLNYSRSWVETPEGSDLLKEVQAGGRLDWDHKWGRLSWRTHVELVFRQQDSRQQGTVRDWAQAFGANVSLGNISTLLGSLGYSYSGTDAEITLPEYGDPLFFYGLGTNLNRHAVRLEFRSRVLRPLDTYLYSRYDSYERDLYGQGRMETRSINNGMRVAFGRLALAADLGTNELTASDTTARYHILNATLDYDLSKSLDLRAQFVQRRRHDIIIGRDFHRSLSVFVNYRLALFTASLIYQKLAWELDGPLSRDEAISLSLTRSFGTRR